MKPYSAGLLELLSNHDLIFYIPCFQRNYEWTEDQCEVFFNDIVKTAEKNKNGFANEHFFGSITFNQEETGLLEPDVLTLIDGQQRITTTMLFLAAFRDLSENEKEKKLIDSRYLRNDDADGSYRIKLKQVESDWTAYKKIILKDEFEATEKDSAVYRNYRYFYNKLTSYQGNRERLLSDGLNRFNVIAIQLQPLQCPWENPQEIFESMNSLGKPLSLSDLVRNYLLLGLDNKKQELYYKKYWLPIEQKMHGNSISNYIRDYMQWKHISSYKKATESNYKELYGIFKDIFSDTKSKDILKDLSSCVEMYSWLMPNGKCPNSNINKKLSDLKYMRVTTAFSFILALLYEWKTGKLIEDDLVEILDAFRIYSLRRKLLGITSSENKGFPILVRRIGELEEAKDKRKKMFDILSEQEANLRLPNDIELRRILTNSNFYNFQYCKFMFALIEETITKSRPDLTDKHLQIEHIMPQTLNDSWKKSLGVDFEETHQTLVNTIGNLTLIRHNQELGQKSFNDKKQIYRDKSGLQIAKTMITDRSSWGRKEISDRTDKLITLLLQQVLPIPDERRRINNFTAKKSRGLSFNELQLIGYEINFIDDPSIKAKVIGDKKVEFEGRVWRLSPLTREIQERRGVITPSGSYQGSKYWEYDGVRLSDII